MIILEVRFDQSGKKYSYLLVNPGNYKINKENPLAQITGVYLGKPIYRYIYAVDAHKVDELPPVVTSQIVLLDDKNNIEIQKIGEAASTVAFKPREVIPEVEILADEEKARPAVNNPEVSAEIKKILAVAKMKSAGRIAGSMAAHSLLKRRK